jgi:predicted small secreted protein
MTKQIAAVLSLVALLALTACNTVAGAGQDVSAVGHGTTKAADQLKP